MRPNCNSHPISRCSFGWIEGGGGGFYGGVEGGMGIYIRTTDPDDIHVEDRTFSSQITVWTPEEWRALREDIHGNDDQGSSGG
jgi:hypothetical protein